MVVSSCMLTITTHKTGFAPISRAHEIAKAFNACLDDDDDTKAIVHEGDRFGFVEVVEIEDGNHVAWIESELANSLV